jgi:hypothetical protein
MTGQFNEDGERQNWFDPEVFGEDFNPDDTAPNSGKVYDLIDGEWVEIANVELSNEEAFFFAKQLGLVARNDKGEVVERIQAAPGGILTLLLGPKRKVIIEVADQDVEAFLGD